MVEKKIIKLSDNIISLIAAGEVIIRPASVIKELVENSIDSGARSIDVWIENGGKTLIIVKDNGCGMGYANLKMCIQNHATSKISNSINEATTFGFRGEALSSIVSIAKITISSRYKNDNNAYRLTASYNNEYKIEPAVLDKGTKVEVRDLFFSLPARLKFLKSDKIEAEYCLLTLKKMALANPKISFSCHINQKEVFKTFATNVEDIELQLREKAKDIFGNLCTNNALYINKSNEDMHVFGLISDPIHARSARDMQFFFVNARPVKDGLFHAALKIGYGDLLPGNKHALAILFVKIDNYLIDVNVHPAKTEIHFRDPNTLRMLIASAIKQAIQEKEVNFNRSINIEPAFSKLNPIYNLNIPAFSQVNKTGSNLTDNSQVIYKTPNFNFKSDLNFQNALFEPLFVANVASNSSENNNLPYPLGAACVQIDGTFIMSMASDNIFFIDQHAAHERIVYEKLREILKEKKFLIRQKLLFPISVTLSSIEEYEALETNLNALEKLGLIYSLCGNLEVKVTEIPSMIASSDIKSLIQEVAKSCVNLYGTHKIIHDVDYALKTFACYNSIRANAKLSLEEMNNLLRKIENTQNSGLCNHGRPTYVRFSFNQIAKWFDRT